MRVAAACLFASLVGAAAPALAQTFPAERAWQRFSCGGGAGPMTDPVGDQGGFLAERDVVGTGQAPAGLRAADNDFLYLRLRLDQDPRQGQTLRPFAWGFAFSTDGQITGYEALVTVDGANRVVSLYRNSVVAALDSPEDPADEPALASYPFATHGRVMAAESSLGGNPDFYLDMAIPWRDLLMVSLSADTNSVTWAGSSTSPNRLNGDLACHDGRGSTRVGSLSESASTAERTASTSGGTGGSGGGPGGSGGGPGGGAGVGGISLEGGPGCAYAAGPRDPAIASAVMLLILSLLAARRRQPCAHGLRRRGSPVAQGAGSAFPSFPPSCETSEHPHPRDQARGQTTA